MEHYSIHCLCECGLEEFQVRVNRDEQVGLLSCGLGHHSLLLDSREYWAETIQDGRPKAIKCRCGLNVFSVELDYEFRNDGEVRSVDVHLACRSCGLEKTVFSFEIDYSPTRNLVSKPLDRINNPWSRARRTEITAYWQPGDAQRFAAHLTGALSARAFRKDEDWEECELGTDVFLPESICDLYFSPMAQLNLPLHRDPHKVAPLLRLSSPFRIAVPSGIALLYYVEYAEEIPTGVGFVKQPPEFLSFCGQAAKWLGSQFSSARGPRTADNPEEHLRIASMLPSTRRG